MNFLRRALDHPFADDEIRVVTILAPRAEPEGFLDLEPGAPAVFWAAAGSPVVAGVGVAVVVRGGGPGRFAGVTGAADRLWSRVRPLTDPGVAPFTPRLLGGFSFLPGPPSGPWAPFGEAAFALPRLTYAVDDDGASLTVAVLAATVREHGPERLLASVSAALDHLSAGGARAGRPAAVEGAPRRPAPAAAGRVGEAAEWEAAVRSIQGRIEAGRAQKIVAARAVEVELAAPVDPVSVLRGLGAIPADARFSFRCAGATFLGATPERLVSRRGLEIRTEALAGSASSGPSDRADALRSNEKDAAEHRFVVRAIADALAPVCDRLDYPPEPEVRRLRHVLHLRTPFQGTLSAPVPVLELVARLHPTPAVGGSPTTEALDWIAREEGLDRGWFASPVGWFDAHGDGDFAVALRSGLLTADRALLYAGAGIVAASDPAAELAETELKLRTMMDALGAAP